MTLTAHPPPCITKRGVVQKLSACNEPCYIAENKRLYSTISLTNRPLSGKTYLDFKKKGEERGPADGGEGVIFNLKYQLKKSSFQNFFNKRPKKNIF